MKKPTPPKPEPEQKCCEKLEPVWHSGPMPLIPVLVTANAVIIAVVLICMSFQQRTIATQRQTIHDLTCHVEGLQDALQDAKTQRDFWFSLVEPDLKNTNRIPQWVWLVDSDFQFRFTNHFHYPPRFLLKD